ncbi:MAG: aminoacyl-tRNA hydrolase [Alphaproteobacteria bacterium]|nr:aminoacyl-tRNA hydrolase [Alphaproteobacteria bacterium]
MWLFAGLGNPGDGYSRNRHNIGFMAIDAIAEMYGFSSFRSKFQGEISEGIISGQKVLLLKPQTMMNLSGDSIQKAVRFYKIEPSRIFIFHDDLDIEPSKLRLKDSGGVAGHNGLKSIKACLGTDMFKRVRLGIGHPGDRNRVSGYVLSDFSKDEHIWLDKLILAVAEYVGLLIEDHESDFMTRVAEKVK